eukprot:jgi/Botrbrau1/3775/Bobra.0183s0010.1
MFMSNSDLSFIVSSMELALPSVFHLQDKLGKDRMWVSGLVAVGVALSSAAQSGGLLRWIYVWAVIEMAFCMLQKRRFKIVNERLEYYLDYKLVHIALERFLNLNEVMSIQEFLSGWFHNVPYAAIKRGNVEDFVSYGFYCRTMAQLPLKQKAHVEKFVRRIEQAWGVSFPEGRNHEIGFMAHLWEPLRVFPKPLIFHLVCEAVMLCCHGLLLAMGFKRMDCQGLTYWLRKPKVTRMTDGAYMPDSGSDADSDDGNPSLLKNIYRRGDSVSSFRRSEDAESSVLPSDRPLFFIHGVGFGLLPYIGFIWQILQACSSHPMLLLEVPHVSIRLNGVRATFVDSVAHTAACILWRHGYEDACFIAHSYGTFCASRICQLYRPIVHSLVLIDPVCFMTCYPHLLYNFVYKVPTLRETFLKGIPGLINGVRFFFSRDLTIAETFCRKFLWLELQLWPEDMPEKVLVVLAQDDDLVPAPLVATQLERHAPLTEVMHHPTAGHGGFLLDFPWQWDMVSRLKNMLQTSTDLKMCR